MHDLLTIRGSHYADVAAAAARGREKERERDRARERERERAAIQRIASACISQ